MSPDDRYDVSELTETQFEPGSDGMVLKNLPGIKSSAEMDIAETSALVKAMDRFVRVYDEAHRFTASDICEFHRLWLGGIYAWAGEYRQVNMSKGDFPFAAAARVQALMAEFEQDVLSTLMALQAGLPLLDFSSIAGEQKGRLLCGGASRVGQKLPPYRPMEKIFAEVIERSVAES